MIQMDGCLLVGLWSKTELSCASLPSIYMLGPGKLVIVKPFQFRLFLTLISCRLCRFLNKKSVSIHPLEVFKEFVEF